MRASFMVAGMALAVLALAACKKDTPAATATTAPPSTDASSFRANPDFGGVTGVTIEASGTGPTPGVAVLRALDSAIAQVNGRRVTSSSAAASGGIAIDVAGLGTTQVGGDAWIEQVVSASDGTIRSFRILSQEEVERVDAEYAFDGELATGGWFGDSLKVSESEKRMSRYWKVRVQAEVAKFVGPKDDGRPRLVVMAARTSSATYPVGDTQVDAAAVAAEIRSRLSDALTQTERFQVLDREFDAELQAEVDFINSGNARNDEVARLGQRLATDLIVVPTIERFEYPRSSRRLRLSGRELTSYSGGGRVSVRVINATTGEVVLSDSFTHQLAPTKASTLPRSIDGVGMAAEMMDALSGRIVKSVVNEIFPVSVIAIEGDQVVLSQGGKSVDQGERYDAVVLGKALTDPQTGRSLGRMEIPCCTIRIDRVSDQTSYGTIEGAVPESLKQFKPGMLELRGLAADPGKTDETTEAVEAPVAQAASAGGAPHRVQRSARPKAAATVAEGDEDW